MTSPRLLRRRRIQSALVWKAGTGVAFLVLTVTCAVSLTLRLYASKKAKAANRELLIPNSNREDESYPGAFVDLWPDDKNTESYRKVLLDCFPSYAHDTQDCRVRLYNDDNGQATVLRVALVHPPGRIGAVFVEFMIRVLNLPSEQSHPIQLVPTSDIIGADHNYSMIVRLATLPALLEASDRALSLNETGNLFRSLSLEEWVDLVRRTIRWQCHITQRAKDTALVTITLDRMIGFPSTTTKKLQKFMGITPHMHDDTKKNRIDLKKLPSVVMDRVNAGSALLQSISPTVPTQKLIDVMTRVIDEEVQASQDGLRTCRPINGPLGGDGLAILGNALQL